MMTHLKWHVKENLNDVHIFDTKLKVCAFESSLEVELNPSIQCLPPLLVIVIKIVIIIIIVKVVIIVSSVAKKCCRQILQHKKTAFLIY